MGTLRAIAAIFRAAAGLDAEQACGLDVIGIEVAPVNALRLEDQVRERQIVERLCFESGPVMARLTKCGPVVVDRIRRRTHHAILRLSARAVKFARAISPQPGHLGPHAKNGVNPGLGIASSMPIPMLSMPIDGLADWRAPKRLYSAYNAPTTQLISGG